jgi:hypothetical protein
MPARYLTLIAVLFLVPVCAHAQRGSATLQATVSETVVLSVLPNFTDENINVFSSGGAVRVTLSSAATEFRVPLLVRSNTGFKISADLELQTAVLTDLSVIDVRATGSLVSPEVVNALVRPEVALNASQPLLVLTGPRVSLGGTLQSPNNALQVTLLIRTLALSPGQVVHLTFTGTAAPLIQ